MITANYPLPISTQAKLLNISRGTVYCLPKPASSKDLAIMRQLDELHLQHPTMGARMLRDQLNRQGFRVGRRHVSTLMKKMGIVPLSCQKNTSTKHPGHKIYPFATRHENRQGQSSLGTGYDLHSHGQGLCVSDCRD